MKLGWIVRKLVVAAKNAGRCKIVSQNPAGRGKNPPAPPRDRRFIALSLHRNHSRPRLCAHEACAITQAKGKKDKKQKSRGNPDTAKA